MITTWSAGSSRILSSVGGAAAITLLALALPLLAADRDPIAAKIQGDCAPWDGAAFRVTIPGATIAPNIDSAAISISIWKAPRIPSRTTFLFTDGRGGVADSGAAVLWSRGGHAERLRGSVTFQSVSGDAPVDGAFDLTAKSGAKFSAEFHATWNHVRMFCG